MQLHVQRLVPTVTDELVPRKTVPSGHLRTDEMPIAVDLIDNLGVTEYDIFLSI